MGQKIFLPVDAEIQPSTSKLSPPANILLISKILPDLYYRDEKTGEAAVDFTLICKEDIHFADPISFEIRRKDQTLLNGFVKIFRPVSSVHKNSNVLQTETIKLSKQHCIEIENRHDVELIFSHHEQTSTFQLSI
jgi:hypothetical protein